LKTDKPKTLFTFGSSDLKERDVKKKGRGSDAPRVG